MSKEPLDMGKWRGLFEWSMKYQDGTHEGTAPQPLDPEKKAWLDQALQDFMKDFADRMKEITATLGSNTDGAAAEGADPDTAASLADKEQLCDELMEIVENVDYARDLHKIGGLPTLLSLMSSPHPSLRWRAAEIAATCMANNPPVQRWFMDGGALAPLLALLADSHPVVATKAVLGLSALVRHYDPALEAFRLVGGLVKLLALLGCPTHPDIQPAAVSSPQQPDADQQQQQQQQQRRRLQRKVLALLQYVLAKHPTDGFAAAEFGVVPRLQQLLSDADTDMRAASLAVLAEVVSTAQGWQWVQQHQPGLLTDLQQLQQQQQGAGGDESGGADEEEVQLLQRVVQVLQSQSPPQGTAQALSDHIELDPYQDGRERAEPKALDLKRQHQQQSQQQHHPESASWALTAVPKQELRSGIAVKKDRQAAPARSTEVDSS